jgi:hypothetical protein
VTDTKHYSGEALKDYLKDHIKDAPPGKAYLLNLDNMVFIKHMDEAE